MAPNEGADMAEEETAEDDVEDGDEEGGEAPSRTSSAGEEAKWKALSRKHERAAKDLAARLKEIEDAGKSDTERLREQYDTAARELENTRTELLRERVARKKGLTGDLADLADRLRGSNEEELMADADHILGLFKNAKSKTAPSFEGGAREKSHTGTDDMNDFMLRGFRGSK